MSNLIKEDYFNLSTMLKFKKPMDASSQKPSTPEHTSKNKGSMNFEDQVMFKKEIDELGVTYLSALTICMQDGCLDMLQWWHGHIWMLMIPPFFMPAKVEEGTQTMLTQVTAMLGHTHGQCAGTLGLGGMLHWHDDAGLVTQGAFPCMHVSKC